MGKEKQERIISLCIEEFALNDYKSASFTKIARKLGITKGGFYRYFESKKTLYNYLLKLSGKLIGSVMEKHFMKAEGTIFETFVDYFLELISLEHTYLFLLPFMTKASEDKINAATVPFWRVRKLDYLKKIIKNQQAKGCVRSDIDESTLAFFLQQISKGIMDSCKLKYNLNYDADARKCKKLSDLKEEVLIKELKAFLTLLKDGMGIQNPS
jgi:TetR/AcrR family transcriptional regulator